MPFQLISTAALAGLETVVNSALRLDASSVGKLSALEGKVLEIHVTRPALSIFLAIYQGEIQLSPHLEAGSDTRISGAPGALLALLTARDKTRVFYRKDIAISGDMDAVRKLQEILSGLQLDWEYQISKLIGDIPTQALSEGVKGFSSLFKRNRDNLTQDLDDYLHRESRLLPARAELEDFYQSLDLLRLRVDRAVARVARLENAPVRK